MEKGIKIRLKIEISGSERKAWGCLIKALCGSKNWSLKDLSESTGISYARIKASAAGKMDLTHTEAEEVLERFSILYLAVAEGEKERVEIGG